MRADGKRNRQAILDAAARVFARDGFLVPMDRIASEAGVGRATLYRNFATREALAIAIYEQNVARFEAEADALPDTPEAFRVLFEILVQDIAAHAALGRALASQSDTSDLVDLRDRVMDCIDAARALAVDGGVLRPDLTRTDLEVLIGTLALGLPEGELELRRRHGERMLDLLFTGLTA